MEGRSAESVIKQLEDAQSFEAAYLNFFGPGPWGRYTFFNPLGPIAVTDQAVANNSAALEERYRLDVLHNRVTKLIDNVRPSLENNDREGPASPHKEYFDRIRDALQLVSKLYSQLARMRYQVHYINEEIARTDRVVRLAENKLREITASLPSVKLPTSTSWMSHTERAGSDGTILVEVAETGPAVSVWQTWTGGNGTMTGTVIVTTIPFDVIGTIELRPPMGRGDDIWTVRVEPAGALFRQTVNSSLRQTAKRIFPAVNLTTTESLAYFVFANPAEARDAYAYFLYHKQVGR